MRCHCSVMFRDAKAYHTRNRSHSTSMHAFKGPCARCAEKSPIRTGHAGLVNQSMSRPAFAGSILNHLPYTGRYYSSYLVFFMDEIKQYGAAATLERYLFKYKDGKLLMRYASRRMHTWQSGLSANSIAQSCVWSVTSFNTDWARC